MKDPIVEEIRRYRDEHARKFNYDLHAICEDWRAREAELGDRIVSLEPKKRPPGKPKLPVNPDR